MFLGITCADWSMMAWLEAQIAIVIGAITYANFAAHFWPWWVHAIGVIAYQSLYVASCYTAARCRLRSERKAVALRDPSG